MTFGSPLWLISLAPLAAVVIYLLWGRRRQEAVPFLDLWTGPVKGPRPSRRFAAPPLALALAILAMLLAVFGAARPALWDPRRGPPLTIIVDRGATMSAANGWVAAAQSVQKELERFGPSTPVDLVVVPGRTVERTDLGSWVPRVTSLAPTAVDTTDALRASIARRLAEAGGPVIVVSNRPVDPPDARVVRVTPPEPTTNAGIALVAARASPRPQVMVRVWHDGVPARSATPVTLRVSSAGREVVETIELGPPQASRDHFIDGAGLGDTVKVELEIKDGFSGDNVAWLVREGIPPSIERRGALPAELGRMIDVYAAARPPASDSPRIVVARDAAGLPSGSAGVVLAPGRDSIGSENVGVVPHPLTRDTRWVFREPVRLAPPPPPAADWTPVVSIGGRTAVAVRDTPGRRVWVGIESDEWPRTPEYVVFWANVFDWLGGGEERYASYPPARLEGAWTPVQLAGRPPGAAAVELGLWPGLYRRDEDGALRAVNAGEARFPAPPADDWRPQLARVLAERAAGAGRPVSSVVLLAAGACAALAAAAWKRSPRRNLAAT